ncbi:MAG: aminotransferase class I/II-fold pyridoxal phosphate-dependent enzyme [Candidatus Heimdallarchaeota archaeon]|nr:aminotransferase class I/II-fold pyridoxal phosphate-dependent enzyme [Candidatus Heimdallarchaeota archaeon]
MRISNRTASFSYAIRDVVAVANEVESKGHKIIKLNIGDPIKYGFKTPKLLTDPLKFAGEENYNYYANSQGILEFREAVANYENQKYDLGLSADRIIATAGVSEGIQMTFMSFTNPGDRVLVPGIHYPSYSGNATIFENDIQYYKTVVEENFYPDPDHIRSLMNDKTKLVFLNTPNNPTGSVYPEKRLKEIIDIVGEYDACIVSDETYDLLMLEEGLKHVPTSKIANDVPVIAYNGFSKVFLAPGWRLGYAYIHDPAEKIKEPWEGLNKLTRLRLCASTPLQKAGAEALKQNQDTYLPQTIKALRDRRDLMYNRLAEMEGISVFKPEAAFYMFPMISMDQFKWKDDKEFVFDFLRKKHVLTVFGSGFGPFGENGFRMVYLPTLEEIDSAMNKLEDLLNDNRI